MRNHHSAALCGFILIIASLGAASASADATTALRCGATLVEESHEPERISGDTFTVRLFVRDDGDFCGWHAGSIHVVEGTTLQSCHLHGSSPCEVSWDGDHLHGFSYTFAITGDHANISYSLQENDDSGGPSGPWIRGSWFVSVADAETCGWNNDYGPKGSTPDSRPVIQSTWLWAPASLTCPEPTPTMTLNGQSVTPTLERDGDVAVVKYQPSLPLLPGMYRVKVDMGYGYHSTAEWVFYVVAGVKRTVQQDVPAPAFNVSTGSSVGVGPTCYLGGWVCHDAISQSVPYPVNLGLDLGTTTLGTEVDTSRSNPAPSVAYGPVRVCTDRACPVPDPVEVTHIDGTITLTYGYGTSANTWTWNF